MSNTSGQHEPPSNVSTAHCPLCGGPNACARVVDPTGETRCWCCDIRISRETLARIPDALRNVACLCRSCATGDASVPTNEKPTGEL